MKEDYYVVVERIKEPLIGDKYIINLRNEFVLRDFESIMLDDCERIIAKGISKPEVEELKKQGIEEV